jgi:hypothetical protein
VPPNIIFAKYIPDDYVQSSAIGGGNISQATTLPLLQAITNGSISFSITQYSAIKTTYTVTNINLSSATTFAQALTLIQTAITTQTKLAVTLGVLSTDPTSEAFIETVGIGLIADVTDIAPATGIATLLKLTNSTKATTQTVLEGGNAYVLGNAISNSSAVVTALAALPATGSGFDMYINGRVIQLRTTASLNFTAVTSLNDIANVINGLIITITSTQKMLTCKVINNRLFIEAPASNPGSLITNPDGTVTPTVAPENTSINWATDIAGATTLVAQLLQITATTGTTLSATGVLGGGASGNMNAITNLNNSFYSYSYVKRLYNDVPNITTPASGYPISVGLAQWNKTQTVGNFMFLPFETLPTDLTTGTIPTITTDYTNEVNLYQMAQVFVANGLGAYNSQLGKIQFNVPLSIQGGTVATPNTNTGTPDVGVYAGFIGGVCASVDFTKSRISLAGKSQQGLAQNVSTTSNYDILLTNGYNVYGIFNANVAKFTYSENGSAGGAFGTIGQHLSATWVSYQEQIQLATLLGQVPFLSYDQDGITQVTATMTNIINACKGNKIIQTGNTFTRDEIQAVIDIVGQDISPFLTTNGYYLYFPQVTPTIRSTGAPLPFYFIYTNGGEVTIINANNVFVQ